MTTNRSTYRITLISALMICPWIAEASAAIPPRYHVTDLGTLGGQYSAALGINDSGQVTGHSQTAANANTNAFLWTPTTPNGTSGTMHDLGRLGGQISAGKSINAGGQVVGWSNTNIEVGGAFLWTPTTPGGTSGSMIGLGTLGGSYSEAWGINAVGQVTGFSNTTGDSADHAFLWTPTRLGGTSGSMRDLGTLGGRFSVGSGINDRGQVTGTSGTTEDAGAHAFLWTPTWPGETSGTMFDLGTLGGTQSEGQAINAGGQVTGNSLTEDFVSHAFLWTPTTPGGSSGTMLDLGTLEGTLNSSVGYGVNARGDVVGQSEVFVGDVHRSHAFLYTSESGMVDLNTLVDPLYVDPLLGWEIQVAWAINDYGQIAGGGYFGDGIHTFLLTPVPEPATAALFALAVLSLFVMFGPRRPGCSFVFRGLVVVSAALFATAGRASAAMFSVASVPELISAIDAANQNAEPDSIALAAGATFTLTDANNSTSGPTGLPTIADSAKLTIVGNGGVIERSTAELTPYFRLFDVAPGSSLALENLTLQGGVAWVVGGAIYNAGNLALDDVTVQNNIAWGWPGVDCRCRPGGHGGPGGAGGGGGIYSSGSLLLENSVLLNNQARGGWGGFGSPPGHQGPGGIGQGGGLYAAAGSATLHNSLVTGNNAVGGWGSPHGSGYGGGIYIASTQVGLDEFTVAHVTGNTASTNSPDIFGPYELIPNPLPGDFNHDGTVDAADYVVWRKNPGGIYTQNDFNIWRAHFGQTAGGGAGLPSTGPLSAAVPEPTSLVLCASSSWAIGIFAFRKPWRDRSYSRRLGRNVL